MGFEVNLGSHEVAALIEAVEREFLELRATVIEEKNPKLAKWHRFAAERYLEKLKSLNHLPLDDPSIESTFSTCLEWRAFLDVIVEQVKDDFTPAERQLLRTAQQEMKSFRQTLTEQGLLLPLEAVDESHDNESIP